MSQQMAHRGNAGDCLGRLQPQAMPVQKIGRHHHKNDRATDTRRDHGPRPVDHNWHDITQAYRLPARSTASGELAERSEAPDGAESRKSAVTPGNQRYAL